MKYFIDTNVFLSIIAHDNSDNLKQSKEFFSKIEKGKIDGITGDIILAEFTWVLGSHYKFPKERITRLLKSIINMPNLVIINNYNSRLAIDLYSKTNVKFVDCVIASIPQIIAKEWTVVSYDEDFKKLPVLWKKPDNVR